MMNIKKTISVIAVAAAASSSADALQLKVVPNSPDPRIILVEKIDGLVGAIGFQSWMQKCLGTNGFISVLSSGSFFFASFGWQIRSI